MTNTELLDRKIQDSGLKKGYLAEQIGLTRQGFLNCRTNEAEFTASQIERLCELLRIDDTAERMAIFFAKSGV